jgi:hypothetical protein
MEDFDEKRLLPDFEPPQASVFRIVKAALPEGCQITKESKVSRRLMFIFLKSSFIRIF